MLNVDLGYVHRIEDLQWIQGAPEAVRRLNEAGYLVIVVTNQSGIGRGYYDEAAMDAVHAALSADLAKTGARIDAFYACPFHPEHALRSRNTAIPTIRTASPTPVFMLRARDRRTSPSIPRGRSFMIGDKECDMEAAARAGRGATRLSVRRRRIWTPLCGRCWASVNPFGIWGRCAQALLPAHPSGA